MNEIQYFKLLKEIVRESKKFGKIIIVVNKNSLDVEKH